MSTINPEELISLILAGLPKVLSIYLFGSVASGQDKQTSDVDVAILCRNGRQAESLWELSQRIASHCGRDVDLVDLRSASAVLRMEIISKGKRIYCADEPRNGSEDGGYDGAYQECENFEDFVYSDYARLNEERALILEDIRKRGTVYG